MRIHIPCTALGLGLAIVAPAAHAETIVTRQIVNQPVVAVRLKTVTRTVRPVIHRRVVVTRRTTVSDRVAPIAPAPAAVATTYPRPVYDVVAPAPAIAEPVIDDTVVAPGAPVPPYAGAAPMPTYHYVYEWDRILVIDDATGIAVQALPR